MLSRREVLRSGLGAALGASLSSRLEFASGAEPSRRVKLPVAAVVTSYTVNSHADVIVSKILEGFRRDGREGPDLTLAALYTDQVPTRDISRALAQKHGFRIAATIDDAITAGTNQVQVAGVLSVGEHGDYPFTPDTKQHMYPRRRFFDEITSTFRRCGKSVPVFNDKHLAYRWADAKQMFDVAKEMQIPFLAGSSVPVAWRYPALELPRDSQVEEALAIGYGGLESYGFHALEALQCVIERRRGGETGVASVQAVSGQRIRDAEKAGQWSSDLFAAALKSVPGDLTDNEKWTSTDRSAAYLIRHRDGLKSTLLMANGLVHQFAVAVKLKGEPTPFVTWFRLQDGAPYGHFAYLLRAIEETIHAKAAAYPVERTLLTTGILDRAMQSLAQDQRLFDTPELDFSYRATDWPFANHPRSTLNLSPDV